MNKTNRIGIIEDKRVILGRNRVRKRNAMERVHLRSKKQQDLMDAMQAEFPDCVVYWDDKRGTLCFCKPVGSDESGWEDLRVAIKFERLRDPKGPSIRKNFQRGTGWGYLGWQAVEAIKKITPPTGA